MPAVLECACSNAAFLILDGIFSIYIQTHKHTQGNGHNRPNTQQTHITHPNKHSKHTVSSKHTHSALRRPRIVPDNHHKGGTRMKLPSLKFNFFTIFLVFGIVLLLLLSVNCSISQNEKTAELRKLNNELNQVRNQGIRLEIEIESRSDFFSVEEFATKELGMRKLENYQIQYVPYEMYGTAELLNKEESEDFFEKVSKAFSVISDFFAD